MAIITSARPNAQIWVITSLQQYSRPQGIGWKPSNLTEPPPEVSAFDFSQYFLLMVFNGFRSTYGTAMQIKGLWQAEEVIYISAHLDDQSPSATVIPVNSSQYNVLKVDKSNLTQNGELTFILLDESGKERAKVTVEVS